MHYSHVQSTRFDQLKSKRFVQSVRSCIQMKRALLNMINRQPHQWLINQAITFKSLSWIPNKSVRLRLRVSNSSSNNNTPKPHHQHVRSRSVWVKNWMIIQKAEAVRRNSPTIEWNARKVDRKSDAVVSMTSDVPSAIVKIVNIEVQKVIAAEVQSRGVTNDKNRRNEVVRAVAAATVRIIATKKTGDEIPVNRATKKRTKEVKHVMIRRVKAPLPPPPPHRDEMTVTKNWRRPGYGHAFVNRKGKHSKVS